MATNRESELRSAIYYIKMIIPSVFFDNIYGALNLIILNPTRNSRVTDVIIVVKIETYTQKKSFIYGIFTL